MSEDNQKQVNINRVTFYTLLEAALRYHEGFYREDCEAFMDNMVAGAEKFCKEQNFPYNKTQKMIAAAKRQALDLRQMHETFNNMAHKVNDWINNKLGPEAKEAMDQSATAYGLTVEELSKAKNTTEFLMICRLYNEGHFNDLLKNINDEKATDNQPNPSVGNSTDSGSVPAEPNVVQENTGNAPTSTAE